MAMAHRNERETILNRILLALPHQVREEILRQCDHVELASGHVIYSAGAPVAHVYFINSGIISLIKSMRDGRSVEIGAVGIEGLVGLFAAYGFDHALVDYVVQVPGTALRISKKTLQNEILIHDTLRSVVMRYLVLLTDQLAQVSACNRLHSLEQRCCHWLLVAHDSVMADKFQLTHEFLALLLGVQRPSVSMTANGLQRRGLIRYSHGHITILNRAAVEEAACECYRTLRGQIDHAFKHPPIEPPRWATLRKV